MKQSFLLMLLLVGTSFNIAWLGSQKTRIGVNTLGVVLLSVLHTIYGVLAVTIFAALEAMDLSAISNFSLFGAVFFMPFFYFSVAKFLHISSKEVFDLFTPCVMTTLMLSRFNCLHSGCCLGMQINGTVLRWPTREAEIVFYLVFLLLSLPRIRDRKASGEIYPLYMVSYGCFRFIEEFFRASKNKSFFHLAHLWAILAVLVGLSIFFEQKEKKKRKK